MLFPRIEDLVDLAAIDVFIAVKTRSESLVTAILADVYGTMSFCHERKGKKILCCLSVLYVWITTRIFEAKSPVEEVICRKPEARGGNEWAQLFASLDENKIRWCPSWQHNTNFIRYCGNFPNVPLIGTRGCINYNPILAQKQFGRPMKGAPMPGFLPPLLVYHEEGYYVEILRQVRSAWGRVVRLEHDSRLGVVDERLNYHAWIIERVKEVRLPFKPIIDLPSNEGPSQDPEFDEVKCLKAELEAMKEKNVKLIKELQSTHNDFVDMRKEKEEKTQAYEEVLRSRRVEKDHAFRVKQALEATNTELAMRGREKKAPLEAEKHWKNLYEEAKREKKEALKKLREAQVQVEEMGHQMKEMVVSFEVELNQGL